MKRVKEKEYRWILKDSFRTTGYLFQSEDGNTYVVWAKDMPNARWLYESRLKTINYSKDCETHFSNRPLIKPYFVKGTTTDKVHHKPFWYYGRIYKLN